MSIKKGVAWTFLGYSFWSACSFLMGILLSKMSGVHGKEMVGIYGTANGLAQPFLQLGAFGLSSIYAARASGDYRFEEFMGMRMFTMLVSFVLLAGWTWIEFPGSWSMLIITLTFMVGVICDRLAEMIFTIYQREHLLRNLGLSQIVRGILSLILFTAGFLTTHTVLGAVAGSALGSILMLTLWDWPIASRLFRSLPEGDLTKRFIRPMFSFKKAPQIAVLAFPIALAVFVDAFAMQLPRTHLATLPDGKNMAGQLTAYMYAIVLGTLLVQAIAATIVPRLGQHWNSDNLPEFRRTLRLGFLLVAVLGLFLPAFAYFFGRPLLGIVFNKTFATGASMPAIFALVVFGGSLGFVAAMVGTGLTAAKVLKFQGMWMVPGLIISVIGAFTLINRYDILGAGLTLVAIGAAKAALGGGVLWQTIRKREKELRLGQVPTEEPA